MKPSSWWGRGIRVLLQLCAVGIILFPVLYALDVSFLSMSQIFKRPPELLPKTLSLQHYRRALEVAPLLRYVLNSLITSLAITIGQIALSSLAAFSFSHFQFKGKSVIFMAILATMMIPGESIVISNYLTMGDLNLLDTYLALILPSLASALSVFFMRQAFMQVPASLYEVARIEGCSNPRYLFTLLLPLTKGSLGAISIYTFINSWNQYLWPLLVTNRNTMRTVQVGIGMLNNSDASQYNMIMAGIVMILVPSILIFFIGQKQILSGTLSGAVKG